jgi:hypothetical protein
MRDPVRERSPLSGHTTSYARSGQLPTEALQDLRVSMSSSPDIDWHRTFAIPCALDLGTRAFGKPEGIPQQSWTDPRTKVVGREKTDLPILLTVMSNSSLDDPPCLTLPLTTTENGKWENERLVSLCTTTQYCASEKWVLATSIFK